MAKPFAHFEQITRSIKGYDSESGQLVDDNLHPFDQRNIHPTIVNISKNLFDDGCI